MDLKYFRTVAGLKGDIIGAGLNQLRAQNSSALAIGFQVFILPRRGFGLPVLQQGLWHRLRQVPFKGERPLEPLARWVRTGTGGATVQWRSGSVLLCPRVGSFHRKPVQRDIITAIGQSVEGINVQHRHLRELGAVPNLNILPARVSGQGLGHAFLPGAFKFPGGLVVMSESIVGAQVRPVAAHNNAGPCVHGSHAIGCPPPL